MISIRDIVQADIPACTGLINAVIEEGLLTWQSARTEGDNTAWLSTLQAQRYPFLVAYNADQLVGIGALEWYWDPEPGSGVEYTCSIFVAVDAGHRRKGIATSLFQKLQGHESTAARQLYLCMSEHDLCYATGALADAVQGRCCPSIQRRSHGY